MAEQNVEKDERRPTITEAKWTFDLVGECIYCQKPCKRQRTFSADSIEDARDMAEVAMVSLCHRKCGGY